MYKQIGFLLEITVKLHNNIKTLQGQNSQMNEEISQKTQENERLLDLLQKQVAKNDDISKMLDSMQKERGTRDTA